MKSKHPQRKRRNAMFKNGRFFHTYHDGVLNWQGVILATTKDYVEVQLFSWLMGEPTEILILPKTQAFWNEDTQTGWKFYDERENWIYAYERYDERRKLKRQEQCQ